MSVNILDTTFPPRQRPQDWGQTTEDLESTTDLHDENTRDLEPEAPADPGSDPAASETPLPQSSPRAAAEEAKPRKPFTVTEAPHAPALAPGVVLSDRYLLEKIIGCGGTAMVYRARDMQSIVEVASDALSGAGAAMESNLPDSPADAAAASSSHVAIKTPRPELADRARATTRLQHEFKCAHLLSHPNIVRVFDLSRDGPHWFMTMELIEGKLLSTLLRESATLPATLAYKILQGCAQALGYAHSRDVVHGDFKPSNIFVTPDESVKIVDFGASAAPSGEDSRIPAGTPAYVSPQVLSGDTPERRDDIFSFACVAYELLTGEHPFERRSSLEARNEGRVPPRAWKLSASQWLALLSALSWERERRPTDLDALLTALAPEAESLTETASSVVQPQRVAEDLPEDLMPPQRSWGFIVFVACALIVTFIFSQRQNEPEVTDAPATSTATTSEPADATPAVGAAAETPGATDAENPAAGTAQDTKTSAPAVEPPLAATRAAPPAPVSQVSFEASSIITSESSVAAVFLIKRSAPLAGRVRVQWRAVSATAEAGSDFAADAAGTVEFADGQAQRAIYVPLLNDLLEEGDETFTVELRAQQSRLGEITRTEATIRDDD